MIRKNIKERLKEYFLVCPTAKLRVRQIERALKLPLPSVIRYTKELEKEGILKKSIIAGVTTFSADRTSKKFLLEKKLFNIKQLFSSGLIDFLLTELSNPAIIVFGSYARGEDTEDSDIDLYVETSSKKKPNLKKYEDRLKREIQLFVYKDIHKIKNKELANNIINGIALNGYVEVFK